MAAASLERVLDSEDEGEAPAQKFAAGWTRQQAFSDCEAIVSDEEDACASGQPAWAWQPDEPDAALRQLNANALLPPQSSQLQQQTAAQSKGFSRNAAPSSKTSFARMSSGSSSSARPGFRRMKTAAAMQADRAAAERAAAEGAELAAALAAPDSAAVDEVEQQQHLLQGGTVETSPRLPRHQQPAAPAAPRPARPAAQRGGFMGRQVLAPRAPSTTDELRRQLERGSTTVAAAASAGAEEPLPAGDSQPAEHNAAAAPAQQQGQARKQPPAITQQQLQQRTAALPTARPAAAAAADAAGAAAGTGSLAAARAAASAASAPAATFHRTADGLNVVFLNRQAQQQQQQQTGDTGGSRVKGKSQTEGVNSGWGNNFVKMDLKVGGRVWCGVSWG